MSIKSQKIILICLLILSCGSFVTGENFFLEYARIAASFSCIASLWFFVLKTETQPSHAKFAQLAHDLRSPLSGVSAVEFTIREKDPAAAEILALAQSRIEKLLKDFEKQP